MGLSPWTMGHRYRQWGYRHRQSVVARGNRGNVASDRDDVAGKYGPVIGKRAEAYKTISAMVDSFVVCGDSTEYGSKRETPGRVVC